MTNRDTADDRTLGDLVDGQFPLHDVHPAYAGRTGADLVARLQVDLGRVDAGTLAGVSRVLGNALTAAEEAKRAV